LDSGTESHPKTYRMFRTYLQHPWLKCVLPRLRTEYQYSLFYSRSALGQI